MHTNNNIKNKRTKEVYTDFGENQLENLYEN